MAFTDFVDPKTGNFVIASMFSKSLRDKNRLGHKAEEAETRLKVKQTETQEKLHNFLVARDIGEAVKDAPGSVKKEAGKTVADLFGHDKAKQLKKEKRGGLFAQGEAALAAGAGQKAAGLDAEALSEEDEARENAVAALAALGVDKGPLGGATNSQVTETGVKAAGGEVSTGQAIKQDEAATDQAIREDGAKQKGRMDIIRAKLQAGKEAASERRAAAAQLQNARLNQAVTTAVFNAMNARTKVKEKVPAVDKDGKPVIGFDQEPVMVERERMVRTTRPRQILKTMEMAKKFAAQFTATPGQGVDLKNVPVRNAINKGIEARRDLIRAGVYGAETAFLSSVAENLGVRSALALEPQEMLADNGYLDVNRAADLVVERIRLAKQLADAHDPAFVPIFENDEAALRLIEGLLKDAGLRTSHIQEIGPIVGAKLRAAGID